MSDIVQIKRMLAQQAQAIAEHLLPAGKREGQEWRAGSVGGEEGHSLGVHLSGPKAGVWSDFGTGDGGDLIDLWMAVRGLELGPALDDIRRRLGVERPALIRTAKPNWRRPARPKCHVPQPMGYLQEIRKLPAESIAAYKVGEDAAGNIIFPFLLPDGTLAMVKRREPIDGAKPVPTEAGCEAVLFGWQAIPPNARTVVITEGEIDAISSHALGYPALSVPFGGGAGGKQKWIESEYDRLERFETILLGMDMDGPGDEAAEEIANRLGKHRCRRIALPHKDFNECLVNGIGKDAIGWMMEEATWYGISGLRRTTDYIDQVVRLFWPREGDHQGYLTPYAKLGGKLAFRPGEVTVWSGDSGAGKSQILNDCVVDWIRQGGRTCLSSLEMRPAYTLKRMAKQIVGTDRPTEEAITAALRWAFDGLFIYDLTGKQKVEEMLTVFDYARTRYGCDLFVIDSLMRLGVAGDDYNSQEAAIYRLVEWTMASNVHVHLVAHSKKGERDRGSPGIDDIKGAMEIGANAFNIISIWRDRKHEENVATMARSDEAGATKLYDERPGVILNVAKQRNGDFEGKIGLWFDQKTYRYRSSMDGPSWQRSYLPDDWNNLQSPATLDDRIRVREIAMALPPSPSKPAASTTVSRPGAPPPPASSPTRAAAPSPLASAPVARSVMPTLPANPTYANKPVASYAPKPASAATARPTLTARPPSLSSQTSAGRMPERAMVQGRAQLGQAQAAQRAVYNTATRSMQPAQAKMAATQARAQAMQKAQQGAMARGSQRAQIEQARRAAAVGVAGGKGVQSGLRSAATAAMATMTPDQRAQTYATAQRNQATMQSAQDRYTQQLQAADALRARQATTPIRTLPPTRR